MALAVAAPTAGLHFDEATLEGVEVAGIVVRHVAASVIEGKHPAQLLLGMSWLGHVSMREEHGVLYLEEK